MNPCLIEKFTFLGEPIRRSREKLSEIIAGTGPFHDRPMPGQIIQYPKSDFFQDKRYPGPSLVKFFSKGKAGETFVYKIDTVFFEKSCINLTVANQGLPQLLAPLFQRHL